MNLATRRAGLLLHPTSLPSGTLADAGRWLDFLQASGVGVWQMLPLGLPLTGLSPYQCASAFAVNPALFTDDIVDAAGYPDWHASQAHWLEDFALFMAIKTQQTGANWTAWPIALRDRDAAALAAFSRDHASELDAIKRTQYRTAMQWRSLRAAARARDIQFFGDMPIFVAHDSADVWARRDLFLLDETGEPTVVTGVPPDYFSATGQRWGNPHYNWAAMQADGFLWWRQRLATHFEWFDLVRIDHYRGLVAAWAIPASEPTAIHGEWQPAPGEALLQAIIDDLGRLPLVAEDLGIITPDVVALKEKFGMPGMAVLQFSFDDHADNPHKPQNITPATVAYTGTHDNDTTAGWWASLPDDARQNAMHQLGVSDPAAMLDTMINTVLDSAAALAMLPLQDVLGLGSSARMNIPGTNNGNWTWRFDWSQLPPDLAPGLLKKLQKAHRWKTPLL
ncbi:MAG TPA: 4-alpha-glucanotransferase [Thiobacillus sp.]|nr:MAG: 4-alpha-glucanotransferase [Hydrogenophilales bacterium 12-64-13]OYZ05089.1 MAG: 4-alpha-glucanotransferase [Hydrogenophilales bacterium 16-64-46]OZA37907.1 MAG: 4-alpha-glucanotransferase [Hydrogenophilales bacterium 17-64-34]HQS83046.1 4-alpha-glucanotransferase [Thiobacillus sp.]HQT00564.1 4-alpha-glucanotransferase [Thiobacillus sp.]